MIWKVTFAIFALAAIIALVKLLTDTNLDKTVLGVVLGIVLREVGNVIQGILGAGNDNKNQ